MSDDRMISLLNRRSFLGAGSAAAAWTLSGGRVESWQDAAAAAVKKQLIVHSRTPHNAEPSLDRLLQGGWLTPLEHFYVRSHAPAPEIDVSRFELSVEGMVRRPFRVKLSELRERFKKHSAEATLTCAGNRRGEHSLVKEVSGVSWQAGAIGNAQWGGARLSDLLMQAGLKEGAKHVWFEGVDEIEKGGGIIPFGGSIPLEQALANSRQTPGAMVAYEMNGKPLLPDHGFPVRSLVPGFIGARSVKWLGKIIVSDRPSENYYVQKAYKLVEKGADDEWSAASPIYRFPINSVTCQPAAQAKLAAGVATVRGYALAPGFDGRTIAKVELSADDGRSWRPARLTTPAKPFCWRLWEARMPLTAANRHLIVRATDSTGEVQPQNVDWNLKGYLFNAWHRTPIEVGA